MGRIDVSISKIHAYHGCLPEESVIGGKYNVDVSIWSNIDQAAKSDELADTVDYVKVGAIINDEMAIRSKLIETVAARILKNLKETFTKTDKIKVTVTKINPPTFGQVDRVKVEIED